jgi:hypothetical protein
MLAAQEMGVATVNGYSSFSPVGWWPMNESASLTNWVNLSQAALTREQRRAIPRPPRFLRASFDGMRVIERWPH